jgi:hypothetical protein
METRTRLQDVDVESGVINDERFNAGRLHRAAKGEEETVLLQQMSSEGPKRKFSTRRRL